MLNEPPKVGQIYVGLVPTLDEAGNSRAGIRLPAIAVPVGLSSEGLPLGLQIIGRAFDEETVLRVGEVLESAAQFRCSPSFVAGGGR